MNESVIPDEKQDAYESLDELVQLLDEARLAVTQGDWAYYAVMLEELGKAVLKLLVEGE